VSWYIIKVDKNNHVLIKGNIFMSVTPTTTTTTTTPTPMPTPIGAAKVKVKVYTVQITVRDGIYRKVFMKPCVRGCTKGIRTWKS
jgi:hypothetical protein